MNRPLKGRVNYSSLRQLMSFKTTLLNQVNSTQSSFNQSIPYLMTATKNIDPATSLQNMAMK